MNNAQSQTYTFPSHLRMNGLFRLSFAGEAYPDLNKALATAQNSLAGAIMAMDETLKSGPAIHEQGLVNAATQAYAEALADLVRGEANSCAVYPEED